jgi:hypothetical protein
MKIINIWFNRTFGTTYHIIHDLKNSNLSYNIKFFGTHSSLESVFLQSCDVVELEPLCTDNEYIDYALDFCKRNKIDIFFPGEFSANLIAAKKSVFESIGVKIGISFSIDNSQILSSKILTYQALSSVICEYIPVHYEVSNPIDFKIYYDTLKLNNELICFKPDNSLGGLGFRIIDENINELKSLYGYPSSRNNFNYYYNIIKNERSIPSLIMMEYLKGPEISVDCLAYNGKLIFSVSKEKKGNLRIIKFNQFLHDICEKICSFFSLNYLFNVQFRYGYDNNLYLLDINTRPSGGLYYAHKAGYPMMVAAVNQLVVDEVANFDIFPEQTFIGIDDSIIFNEM